MNQPEELEMDETLVPDAPAAGSEIEDAGQAAKPKANRKTLEELLAENQAEQKRIVERIKQRDKEARVQYEKDLWALLRSQGWDEVPLETWREGAKAVSGVLKVGK